MNKPKFPIISFYNNSLEIYTCETSLKTATIISILKANNETIAFDYEYNKWTYRLIPIKVKVNLLTRILAYTFYNPIIDVIPQWEKIDSFKLKELKEFIIAIVEKDDDILTQFIEPSRIKQLINNSDKFESICETINKCIFGFDKKMEIKT